MNRPLIAILIALLAAGCTPPDPPMEEVLEEPPVVAPEIAEPQLWIAGGQSNMVTDIPEMFAEGLSLSIDAEVSIIQTALLSTAISCWRFGAVCFEQQRHLIEGVQANGVIWWQGESDALSGSETYEADLVTMIQEWRDVIGVDAPFLIVELQLHPDSSSTVEEWQRVQDAQHAVATTLPGVYVIETSDIVLPDANHHPTYAYRVIAQRLADKAAEISQQK